MRRSDQCTVISVKKSCQIQPPASSPDPHPDPHPDGIPIRNPIYMGFIPSTSDSHPDPHPNGIPIQIPVQMRFPSRFPSGWKTHPDPHPHGISTQMGSQNNSVPSCPSFQARVTSLQEQARRRALCARRCLYTKNIYQKL